jgi:hypothetical protein
VSLDVLDLCIHYVSPLCDVWFVFWFLLLRFWFLLGLRTPHIFLVWFKCPFTVASDFSRYFVTCSGVSVDQVVKFPAFIALTNVDGTREPAAACKYCMASYTLLISYTFL